MHMKYWNKAFVFDLGDVLFQWTASTTTTISPKILRAIIASDTWVDLDCGRISQDECFKNAAEQHHVSLPQLYEAFAQARDSVRPNEEVIASIRSMRMACRGTVKVYAMSNMSKEDYAFLAPQISRWDIFDDVFISGHVGYRKPDSAFFDHVLDKIQTQASDVVFIDDKAEKIHTAQTMGMTGILFNDNDIVLSALRQVKDEPSAQGWKFLLENIGNLESVTSNGFSVDDNFAKLLIQDVLGLDHLVEADWDQKRTWNFFRGPPVLVPGNAFPDDLDTTSLALMVVPPKPEISAAVLDDMLQYLHPDGCFQTYFDPNKIRLDEIVSANVLACFYHFHRGHQVPHTLDMLHTLLLNRTYLSGTRYYPYADCCLYFLGRLLRSSDDAELHAKLFTLLRSRVQERVGCKGSAIELAMRVITCQWLGIGSSEDVRALLEWQQDDGGWPASWIYQYGSTGVKLGNRGVTTAMAVKAIEGFR